MLKRFIENDSWGLYYKTLDSQTQTGRHIDRHTDRQTHRQTHTHARNQAQKLFRIGEVSKKGS
jgi:hypothetical protein